MVRTLLRSFHFIFLIPYWEGLRADPEEKQGPASGIEKLPRSQRHSGCYRAQSRQGQAAFGGGCAIHDFSCARQHVFCARPERRK